MVHVVVVDTSAVLDAILDRIENPEFVALVSKAKHGKITIVIPEIVLFELAWVLKSRYEKVKQDIVLILRALCSIKNVQIEHAEEASQALELFAEHGISFSDARILVTTIQRKEAMLVTQDRKLRSVWRALAL